MRLLWFVLRKLDTTERKIELLSALPQILQFDGHNNLTSQQWQAIQTQIRAVQAKLSKRLKNARIELLKESENQENLIELIHRAGAIELELTNAFNYFDTFLDMLSQRLIPGIGRFLKGCDILAEHSLRLKHPVLQTIQKPLVYFDRGFGASVRREGIRIKGNFANPIPTIQIPYFKIVESHTLISIFHEVGHIQLVQLGLKEELQQALSKNLSRQEAGTEIINSFNNWLTEIFPDFIGFLNTGISQAINTKEILSLTPERVFHVTKNEVHPPPYLRVLIILDWCKYNWGKGIWDDIEDEWKKCYPLEYASPEEKKFMLVGLKYIRTLTTILFDFRFTGLGNKPITSLCNLEHVSPENFKKRLNIFLTTGEISISDMNPSAQLGFLTYLRYTTKIKQGFFHKTMSKWLHNIAIN